MTRTHVPLLTLIKLREGHLPEREGVAVREQLAADSQLLQQWKTLSQVDGQTVQLGEDADQPDVDAVTLAEFVEEQLNPEQCTQLERACWEQPELLREVIAAYQAAHLDWKNEELPPAALSQAGARLRDVLAEQMPVEVTATRSSKKTNRETQRSSRNRALWFSVAVVLLLVVGLPAYYFLVRQPTGTSITEVPANDPAHIKRPDQQTNTDPRPLEPLQPELAVSPERKPAPQIMPAPNETSPAVDPQDEFHPPLVARKPLAETPAPYAIQWSRWSGIAGIKAGPQAKWQGVLAGGDSLQLEPETMLELRTFPDSWLQGVLNAGPEFVLDANAALQFAVEGDVPQQKQTELALQFPSGRVALSRLREGDIVRLQDRRQEWRIEVLQDETALAFLPAEENQRELVTLAGEVRILPPGAEPPLLLKAEQMLLFKDRSVSLPLKWRGNQEWRFTPPGKSKLNPTFVANLNQSDNLLASLLAAPASRTPEEVVAATNLSFDLDPALTVPRAGSSGSELQRTAAIEWLLAAKEDPQTRAVWNKLKVIETATSPALPVQTWFQLAQRKAPANRQLLRELSLGLGARQPLFVRQCSIHFLRQLTRQTFAEYDPARPSPAAINSVLQKLRRLSGGSGRPAGNNTQRQR